MNINQQDVIDSLLNKLAQAEYRASQYEAVVIELEKQIKELEQNNTEETD